MTRIKTLLKNSIVKENKEITSKRGNKYFITVVENEGNEISLYNPSCLEFETNHVYDLELEVIISKYSNIKILSSNEVKKGLFK